MTKEIGSILNFNLDVPCRTSPRSCSRGFPGGCIFISFFTNLVDKYLSKIHRNYDDCFINDSSITFKSLEKKEETRYRSFQILNLFRIFEISINKQYKKKIIGFALTPINLGLTNPRLFV